MSVAPLIRDLGVALAMRPGPETVRMVLSAQMGKAGPPMHGKDLHMGDLDYGILPAAAPLSIGSLTISRNGDGLLARGPRPRGAVVHRRRRLVARRVARGDQPVRRTKTARGVLRAEQSDGAVDTRARAVRRACVRGQGAVGYGIPGITIDGTDADEVAAAFAWAVERARGGLRSRADRARVHAHVRPRAS